MTLTTSPQILELIDAQDRALARADAVTMLLVAAGADIEGFDIPHPQVMEAFGLVADLIAEARTCTRGIDALRMAALDTANQGEAEVQS